MKRIPLVAALAAVTLAGCGKEAGPVAGDLVVAASAVPADVRAVLLRVVGPVTTAAAPEGTSYRVFAATSGDTTRIAVIAPPGVSITAGPVAVLTVPDTRRAAQYIATAVQASNASYQLVAPNLSFEVAEP